MAILHKCRTQPVLSTASPKFPMVGNQHVKPMGFRRNCERSARGFSSPKGPLQTSVSTFGKGNPKSLGNHTRISRGGCNQGNPTSRGETPHTVVYHRKGGQIRAYNPLQGNKTMPATKTLQTRKLGRNIPLSSKRDVGGKKKT